MQIEVEISAKERLKNLVKEKFGKPLNSLKSFEELAGEIQISSQTLRRFFGKIDHDKEIGTSSLSVISKYVGFSDWKSFVENHQKIQNLDEKDKVFIENMSVFFHNGEKYNIDYLQKTLTSDTLNDYAKTIYFKKENTEYFYELYHKNNWATDYILAWIPNYNLFGQNWFRKILFNKSLKTKVPHVKLSQTNFLFFGAFLSKNKVDFIPKIETLKEYYLTSKKEFGYLLYHEMRYHTVLLMNAKNSENNEEIHKIIFEYLKDLEAQNFSEFNYQELLIFFCNALLWLQEYEVAYALLKSAKNYLRNYPKKIKEQQTMHYYGMNLAFVKTTFALAFLANSDKNISDFEISHSDFNDFTDLLYHDYIRVMFLAKCILEESSLFQKKIIFKELKTYTQKTNYTKIFDILKDLDKSFEKYFY